MLKQQFVLPKIRFRYSFICQGTVTKKQRPTLVRITSSVHKPFHLSPPRLTIPTNPLRLPLISLSLHLVLTTRIPSAFFNGTQVASPHPVVPTSVPFFSPICTIWRFSKRLISPALGTLKFQATLSS